MRQLLKGQALGEQKPSHLLNHMRQLNGGQCSSTVLKSLFIEQLPETQRDVLIAINEPDLQKLAEIADKIAEMSSFDIPLAAIRSNINPIKTNDHELTNGATVTERKLAEICKRLAAIEIKVSKMYKERSVSRGRSKSRPREANNKDTVFVTIIRNLEKKQIHVASRAHGQKLARWKTNYASSRGVGRGG